MTSQLAQYGDVMQVAEVAGLNYPIVQTSTPGAPVSAGQLWVNASGGSVVSIWNPTNTTWQSITTNAQEPRYIAMCVADPILAGVTTIAGLNESQTPGYARQSVTFSTPTAAYPSQASNTNLLTFGPVTSTMTVGVQWAALVTVSSGNNGYFLASWALAAPITVNASQSYYCGIGQLVLQGQ